MKFSLEQEISTKIQKTQSLFSIVIGGVDKSGSNYFTILQKLLQRGDRTNGSYELASMKGI